MSDSNDGSNHEGHPQVNKGPEGAQGVPDSDKAATGNDNNE